MTKIETEADLKAIEARAEAAQQGDVNACDIEGLLVLARQDIPALTAALREARRERDEAREEIEILSRERKAMDENWAELEAEDRKWRSGPGYRGEPQ